MKSQNPCKSVLLLGVFSLLGVACGGSSTDSVADSSLPETTLTTEAPTTTQTTIASEPEIGVQLDAFLTLTLGTLGVDSTDELKRCISNRSLDPDELIAQSDDELNKLAAAVFACAPAEMAAQVAPTLGITEGSPEDVECVLTQVFILVGEMDPQVANELLSSTGSDFPVEIEDDTVAQATGECGMSEEEVRSIVQSQGGGDTAETVPRVVVDEELAGFISLAFGLQFDQDGSVAACMSDRGVVGSELFNETPGAEEAFTASLFVCASEQLALSAVAGSEIGVGTEDDQLCALTEFYMTIGDLDEERLAEVIGEDSAVPPQDVQDAAVARASLRCELSEAEARAILEAAP